MVYGLVGYKIHCKATLVVRRDADAIRRRCLERYAEGVIVDRLEEVYREVIARGPAGLA